ncbi:Gag protein [Operophtera brumata]|uniref:Gag protein n=1 Tax=Operophtera brumata TaxID=104452 RepID=A0A0L7KTD8_OPEBR|nr:Gag protein [Operophtera brumata]
MRVKPSPKEINNFEAGQTPCPDIVGDRTYDSVEGCGGGPHLCQRFRQAVTGARMLEVPGEDSGPKADALAAKLRELFDEDILRVTRPVKCAELRVAGLDDSVTETDVMEAIARVGACCPNEVKVAGIRRNAVGLGSAFVRCPVSAAKKVPATSFKQKRVGNNIAELRQNLWAELSNE